MQRDFPYDIMSGAAQNFSELYAANLECPQEFFFHTFMTCLGCLLSGRLSLNSELETQPRLYTVLLGESADVRKSTAINVTVALFQPRLTLCCGAGSAEGLATMFKDSNNVLLVYDEFKHFHDKAMAKESTLLTCTNTLFEGNRYQSAVKDAKQSTNIVDAHLSILGASTLKTYETMWTTKFTDIGFINRLWIVPGSAEKKHAIPNCISTVGKQGIGDWIDAITDHVGDRMVLLIETSARREYDKWYMSIPVSEHSKRLDAYALRLLCLFAANDFSRSVTLDIVQRVTCLCDWQLSMRETCDPVDADNEVAKMEERIRRCLHKQPDTIRNMKQAAHTKRYGIWCFERALDNLMREGEVNLTGEGIGINRKYKLIES
ncbi:MAG: hypothetical protein WC551_09290 [Patescibacteria group bacterium]